MTTSKKTILFIALGVVVLTSFPSNVMGMSVSFVARNIENGFGVWEFGSLETASICNDAQLLDVAAASEPDSALVAKLQRQIDQQDQVISQLTNENVRLTNSNDLLTALVASLQQQKLNATATSETANLHTEAIENRAGSISVAPSNVETSNQTSDEQKYAELQNLCNKYVNEIERLRAENTALRSGNDSLRAIVAQKNQETEQMSANNAKLMMKVNGAAMLMARDLRVTSMRRNLKTNAVKETNRASATNTIRIDGNILDNNVVEPGTLVIYARIVSANNRVIVNFNEFGEPIDQYTEINGIRTLYTASQDFEYTGENRSFSIVWNKNEDVTIDAGVYKVTLYANGNVIGTTTFRLK